MNVQYYVIRVTDNRNHRDFYLAPIADEAAMKHMVAFLRNEISYPATIIIKATDGVIWTLVDVVNNRPVESVDPFIGSN